MPRSLTVALIAVTAPLLAACGSSNSGGGLSAASKHADAIAFAACMRAHGVPNFPDPSSTNGGGLQIQSSQRAGSGPSMTVNGVSVSAPAFQSAMQVCRSKLPHGGRPPAAVLARARAAALHFSACMRAHGVTDFPDPQFLNGGAGIRMMLGAGSGIDPNSPAFKSAQQACGSIIGKGFGKVPTSNSG
jgi:hypothetical protein